MAAEKDVLLDAVKRIEAARSEHWQQHLRDHPYSNHASCPRDYGIHDAYAHAATIVREMIRERRVTPPAATTTEVGRGPAWEDPPTGTHTRQP